MKEQTQMLEQYNSPKITEPKYNTVWLPVLTASLLFLAFALFAWMLSEQQNSARLKALESANTEIAALIEIDLNSRVATLERMAKRWQNHGSLSPSEFSADAQAEINNLPGFQAIEWVDTSFYSRWVVPLTGNEAALNFDMTVEKDRLAALETARSSGAPSLTSALELAQGEQGFLIFVPIIVHDQFEGFILGVVRTEAWSKHVLNSYESLETRADLRTSISLDDTRVFTQTGWDESGTETRRYGLNIGQTRVWEAAAVKTILGQRFTAQSRPTARFFEQNNSSLPEWILLVGLLFGALFGYGVRLFQKASMDTWRTYAARMALEAEVQKHQETAGNLHQALSRLEMATQTGGIGIWSWHLASNFLTWNERMYNLYDIPPDVRMFYETWRARLHPEDRAEVEALLQSAIEGTAVFKTEYRILCHSGEVHYLGAAARVERDFAGRAMQVNGISWDITDLKRTEIYLNERVKELTCLDNMGRLVANESIPEAELCQQTLQFLTTALQTQDAAAEIELNGRRYQTANYSGSHVPYLTAPILIHSQKCGQVAVYSTQQAAPIPLLEEQNLLYNIANRLGLWQERKSSESAIRELSQAVTQSPVSLIITDTAGNITYANPCFTNLTGYSLEEIIGQNPRILRSGQTSQQEYQQLWETILAGNIWQGQFCNRKKNGEFFWEQASISPIRDETGKIINFMAVKEDITERLVIDKMLSQSEANNQALLRAIPDLIIRLQRDGTILDYQANSIEMASIPRENIIGSALGAYLDKPAAEKLKVCIEEALQSEQLQSMRASIQIGSAIHFFEARFKNSGEEEVIAIVRDVSQENRLEKMKSDFVIRATHELRMPISTMLLMVSLLEGKPNQEEDEQYWSVLKDEINRVRQLVENLLNTGRLENDQYQFSFDLVEIDEVIEQVIQNLEYSADDKNIRISVESNLEDSGAALIMADKVALTQALGSVLENAIKFTPDHGKVHIHAQRSDSGVQISVSDTGIGIPSEDLPMLFKQFFRGSNGIEEEIQGVGLGLYIVRSILEKHAGSITVNSELGKGSEFVIRLPCNQG